MRTRWNWLLIALMFFAYAADGQETIPPGTVIPARLNGTLSFHNARPNQNISARVMQDVPLPNGLKIREGARISGHVVEVRPGKQGTNPSISFTFDHIRVSKHGIPVPITMNLRALASFTAVEEAGIPLRGMGEGDSWDARTTVQIGGDTVYWGGGPVVGSNGIVGKPINGSDSNVIADISAKPGTSCRGAFVGNQGEQAVWVFSSDACGVYGLSGLRIIHAGRTEPIGLIELSSGRDGAKIPSGSGMLLRIIGAGGQPRTVEEIFHSPQKPISFRPLSRFNRMAAPQSS